MNSCVTEDPNNGKPNIILINIDDMGWRDLGFLGSKFYETPNIDALSALGMVFSNEYAAAANCAPSLASRMTGKWSSRHGIYTVDSSARGASKHRKLIPTKNIEVLSKEHQTIPEILKELGYTTCHSGKWHISEDPLEYGFDKNIGGTHYGHPKNYYPPYENVPVKGGEDQYLTDLIMENTLGFINSVEKAPFFCIILHMPFILLSICKEIVRKV